MNILLILVLVLLSAPVQAAEYWVATNGNDGVSCSTAQNSSTPKLTIAQGIACMVGGDTLILKAGPYHNQQITNPPAGTASAYTIIKGDPSGARPLLDPNADGNNSRRGVYCSRGETCKYIEIRHLEITNGFNGMKLDGTDSIGYAHHWRIIDNYFRSNRATDILTSTSATGFLGGDHLIQANEFARTGDANPEYSFGHNTIYDPGNRSIVEHNYFHDLTHGVAIWPDNKLVNNVIIRYNLFYQIARFDLRPMGANKGTAIAVSNGGGGHQIYGNVIRNSFSNANGHGIVVNMYFGATQSPLDIKIYNNTIYNSQHASSDAIRYSVQMSPGAVLIRNNIVYLAGDGIITTGMTNFVSENNRTTNPSFTNASSGDLSLASGSAAINAGTAATGFPYCGSAPDQGAFETLGVTAASISGNVMLVTVCNAKPPVIPGTFTVGCTGVGCGTPTVTSTALLGGSGGIVRLETSVTCDDSQTWTVSAGSTTTDSTLVGNTLNQALHTVTNFPVDSSACNGSGGPAPPASDTANYEFEGDLLDSSGNLNHATGSNTSFTTGRSGQGVLTTENVDSYIDTGVLNAYNPSTNHLVVAAWVYIDPTDLGQTKDIWGISSLTNRFFLYRSSANVFRVGINTVSGGVSEFAVPSGWTHCCIKMNPTGDIATLYINGVAGTVEGASLFSNFGSYTFSSTLRFGLPSGFATTLSGAHIYDDAFIYTSDVSCTDLFNAGSPEPPAPAAEQVAHQWQGVFLNLSGVAENRGAQDATHKVVVNRTATLLVQINNTSGSTLTLQPRFRYNIDGGAFNTTVPDDVTADAVSYWGATRPGGLYTGIADGPIEAGLTHTDGIVLLSAEAVPTIEMANNTSYTLAGTFRFGAPVERTVCFKVYDQSGTPLSAYTPAGGACVEIVNSKASTH